MFSIVCSWGFSDFEFEVKDVEVRSFGFRRSVAKNSNPTNSTYQHLYMSSKSASPSDEP